MPAKSKAQYRLMQAVAHSPKLAKKTGIPASVGEEFAEATRSYKKLPERKKEGGVSLSVGRGEKLSVDRGAGLTQKGREKYNRETGSHLKAPQPQGGARKNSFCARMAGVVRNASGDAPRAKASLRRWKCSGW